MTRSTAPPAPKKLNRIEVDRLGDPESPTDRGFNYTLYINGIWIAQLYIERHDKTPLLLRHRSPNKPGSALAVKLMPRSEAAALLRHWRKAT